MEKIKIGLMGGAGSHSGQDYEHGVETAYEMGKHVAERDAVLVTGATTGLCYAAVLGAYDAGGETLGVSHAADPETHVLVKPLDHLTAVHFTGAGLIGREYINIAHSDGIVVAGGGSGTAAEVNLASQLGLPIGGLLGVGGYSAEIPENIALPKYGSGVVGSCSPQELVDTVIAMANDYVANPENIADERYKHFVGQTKSELAAAPIIIGASLDDVVQQGMHLGSDVREILKEVRT